jgi:NADPH:quinone reductase-like Zn-dependent oxidoreductase
MIFPRLSCGCCEFCRAGEQSLCSDLDILGIARNGTFAEQVAVPVGCIAPKPEYLSFAEASALGIAYTTAWRMLTARAQVSPGETVLIHGIGGGVALAALQFCAMMAVSTIVTSSSDEKLTKALQLGATHTINYGLESDVGLQVRELTDGRGADVAFDTVGAATWNEDFRAVRRGGRIVLCGVTTGSQATTDLRSLYWNQLTILGSTMGSDEDYRLMVSAIEAAELHPVIDSIVPLSEVRHAAERMEAGEQFGKIVLEIAP